MVSRDWLEKDFYKVMGVAKDAPTSDIKKAYRQLVRELHPDHNPGNSEAEARFKDVSEAYSVLSDDQKRKEYDETRSLLGAGAFRRAARMGEEGRAFDFEDLMAQARAGAGGFGSQSGGLGDLFGSFFGGPKHRGPTKGRDVETSVALEFTDAVNGITLPLKLRSPGVCDNCHGSGAKPGTTPQTCPTCLGAGVRTVNQGAFSLSEPCRDCDAVGTIIQDKCAECQGSGGVTKTRTMSVRMPAGVRNGQRIRLAGRGEPGTRGGASGDLYVLVTVKPHALFGRDGDNLLLTLPVSFTEAALGANLRVPTLEGPVTLRVPAGTPSGRTLRVRDHGVARANNRRGDLLITIDIDVPKNLSPEARKALEEFADNGPKPPRDEIDQAVAVRP